MSRTFTIKSIRITAGVMEFVINSKTDSRRDQTGAMMTNVNDKLHLL